ncbi:MAG: serine/threonine-protein kinase [Planctomycetota bacterium]
MKPTKKSDRSEDLAATDTTAGATERTAIDRSPVDDAAQISCDVTDALELLEGIRKIKSSTRGDVEALPKTIGRYKILGSAGRGGFSEVFHAIDIDLERHVALKVPLIAGRQDCEFRFEREARLAALLTHPQIVPVYEYGSVGQIDFIAYAWVDGETLGDWLDRHDDPVDMKLAAKIVAALASAIHFAHQRGVIHRDLKPANILIDQSEVNRDKPLEDRTRITDLGLSRQLSENNQRLTQTGQAIGTPAYMSPEQAGGESEIGVGADIYALGTLLFELLAGVVPFKHPNIIETMKLIHGQPAPSISNFRSGVSRELQAIVEKCLHKQPSQRYASAFELAEDLHAFINGRTVSAKPAGWLTRTKRWIARNPVVTVTSLLVVLSLSVGLGTALWQWNHAEYEKARAEKHLINMTAAVDLLLDELIAQNEPTKVTPAQRQLLSEVLELQQGFIGDRDYERVSRSHVVALCRSSQIFFALGKMEQAVASFEELRNNKFIRSDGLDRDLAEQVLRFYKQSIAALNEMDHGTKAIIATEEMSQFQSSVEHLFSKSESLAQKISVENLRGVSLSYSNEMPKALAAHQRAQTFADELIQAGEASDYRDPIATNLINLANQQHETGDYRGALASIDRAMAWLIEELENNPDFHLKNNLANLFQMQAMNYSRLMQNDRGKSAASQSIKLLKELVAQAPENHTYIRSLATAYSRLALCTWAETRKSKQETIKVYDRILELQASGLDKSPSGCNVISWALAEKGSRLALMDELEESLQVSKQAVRFAEKHFTDDDGRFGVVERYRARSQCMNILNRLDRSQEFIDAFPEFAQLIHKTLQRYDGSPRVVHVEKIQAWTYRRAAKHYASITEFKNALATIDRMSRLEMHLRYPEVDLARVTSQVIGIWMQSDEYPTPESQAAMDRAFQWLTAAIVEKNWTNSEFFEREDMRPIVEDPRFEELKKLMSKD